jgi:ribosomal protein S18 acetylase RimI-like enzyme
VIRPARAEDADAILEVWRRAGSRPSVSDTPEALARLLARDADSLLVAEADGEIVGTLIAAWDGWRGNMYRLAVVPEQQRRGLARALVDEGERRLRAKGAPRFSAVVLRAKDGAESFWRASGYERQDDVGRWVKTASNGAADDVAKA